jgi:hypothetical protein
MRGTPAVLALAACAVVALASIGAAHAQQQSATLSMTADRTEVSLGDLVRLQVRCDIVNAQPPEVELPDLSAFEIVSRQVARPMQFSMGWGGQQTVMQSTTVHTFVLRPQTTGTVQLRSARVTVGGRVYQSNPLTIVVGPRGAAPPPPQPPPVQPAVPSPYDPVVSPVAPAAPTVDPSRGTDGYVYDDRAFLRTVVDEREPYVGQQITVTTYLYLRQPLSQWPTTTQEPTTDGFWVRDLLPPTRTPDPTQQRIQGVPFMAYVMRRVAAFPLREGDLTIGAMSLNVQQGSPFDALLGQAQPPLDRTGVPVQIHVRPLPDSARPPGAVHVGTLTLEASLDRTQAPTGDAVTLTVRASGTGQIDSLHLDSPTIAGASVLAPQIETEMTAPGDRVTGVRTYEWLVVPEQPGEHTIPAFRVNVFDPRTGIYTVASSAAMTLTSAGNGATPPPEPPSTASDDGATPDATPLGPVRTESALERHRTHLARQPWFPWAVGFFPVAWVLFLGARSVRRRVQSAGERVTPAKVAREAKKRLQTAEESAKANDGRGFYGALSLAISAVVEGKLGESVGSLTRPQLRKRLVERGMSDALAQKVASELEGADFARYSTSGGEPKEMDAALARAREILAELDRFVATEPED